MAFYSTTAGQDWIHLQVKCPCLEILHIQHPKTASEGVGWIGGIRCNYKTRIRRSKNSTERNVGEDWKAKLKGERKIAEKVKGFEIFQAQRNTRSQKHSAGLQGAISCQKQQTFLGNQMNSHPQCSAGQVEVQMPERQKPAPRRGGNAGEITLTQDQPTCSGPVMPPSAPGRHEVTLGQLQLSQGSRNFKTDRFF